MKIRKQIFKENRPKRKMCTSIAPKFDKLINKCFRKFKVHTWLTGDQYFIVPVAKILFDYFSATAAVQPHYQSIVLA